LRPPRPLSDLGVSLDRSPGRGKRGYGLRLAHYTASGPDAIIVLERGAYRVRRTRLRGARSTDSPPPPTAGPAGWNGTISGTASTPAINLAIQGNGTFDAEACDTGPMSVSAERRDPI
jgi:hypothetical protein